MNIGIVTPFVYPHDQEIRVKKIARSLIQLGHEVNILCNSDGTSYKIVTEHGVHIYRINYFKQIQILHRFVRIPLPFNFFWYFWLLLMARKLSLDMIIGRDLKLALPVTVVGKVLGIKAVLDFGENFVASHQYRGSKGIFIIRWLEKLAISLADKVWVVVEENRQRIINDGYAPSSKVAVLTNVPSLSDIPEWCQTISHEQFEEVGEIVKLVFLGMVTQKRGVQLVLEALSYLRNEVSFIFTIIGDGPDLPRIRDLAEEMGLASNMEYLGWVSEGKYAELLRHHLGLIPHVDCEHTQTTIPNKIFDYMSIGLPVLTTDLRPINRIIDECHCGWVVQHEPLAMADRIKRIISSPDEMFRFGQNGFQAVKAKYNWENEFKMAISKLI